MIMAFVRALELEQPVVLGCSMGGAVVLELASRHATEVSAVIGLEAAGKIEGRFSDWTVMPDVDGSVGAASWTYGLMAPQSPGCPPGGVVDLRPGRPRCLPWRHLLLQRRLGPPRKGGGDRLRYLPGLPVDRGV